MQRICIYTKDVQIITGKSDKYCRAIMKCIRTVNKKEKHQPVSIFELANYLALDVQEIMKLVK